MDPTGLASGNGNGDSELLDEIIIITTPSPPPPQGGLPTFGTRPIYYGNILDLEKYFKNPFDPMDHTDLQEVIIDTKPKEKEAKNDTDWKGVNDNIGAFGIANGLKINLIDYASEGGQLTKTTNNYLKFFKGAAVAGGVFTTAYSGYNTYDQYQQGGINEVFSHRDILDFAVGGADLVATGAVYFGMMSNPVGWGIGVGALIYFGGTMIYDHYNP